MQLLFINKQYQKKKKKNSSSLPGKNKDCYSWLAVSSRSSLRAEDVHNKIANKNRKKREAAMHDAGERLQLIALSFRALGKRDWQGMRSAP
jgi:hypothetical protein